MRYTALLLVFICLSSEAFSPQEQDKLNQCRQIADKAARLACYDSLMNETKSEQAIPAVDKAVEKASEAVKMEQTPPPAPEAPQKVEAQVKPAEPQVAPRTEAEIREEQTRNFGVKEKDLQLVTKVFYVIKALKKDVYGKYVITFDNDQEWKQIQSDRITLREGDKVYIEEGVIGSFWLGMDNKKKRIRVKRSK